MEKEQNHFVPISNMIEIKNDTETRKKILNELSLCRGSGREGDCQKSHIEETIKPDERIVNLLLKEFSDFKITITSGYRCPKHNQFSVEDDKSGMTKKDSLHTKAQAVDFILLDKSGQPLSYDIYQQIIDNLNLKYHFSQNDWEKIYAQGDQDYLSYDNKKMIFAKAYKSDEGRDTDNKHPYAYMHIDYRGINQDDPAAWPYYNLLKNT